MTSTAHATPALVQQLERQWAAACAAAIRAERAYQHLVAGDEDGDALSAAAWLALWRAEERQREIAHDLDLARAELSNAA
jgi:hypothetical protein